VRVVEIFPAIVSFISLLGIRAGKWLAP